MALFKNGLTFRFHFIVMIISSNAVEPHCSKFPYEEALLEKMVRMEFELEKIRERIDKVKEQVVDELEKVTETRKEFKSMEKHLSEDWTMMKNSLDAKAKQLEANVSTDRAETKNNIKLIQEENEQKLIRMSEDLTTFMNETIKSALDGGWSTWSSWDTCSTTCGVGMTNRRRQCNNPTPGQFGKRCDGDSTDIKLCNTNPCSEDIVLFGARSLADLTLSNGQALVFQTVLTNEGDGYDPETGVFTVPTDGVYIFSVQICVATSNYFNFAFYVNDTSVQAMSLYSNGDECSTGTMIQSLKTGSRVNLKSTTSSYYLYHSSTRWNMFYGVLIKPYTSD